MPDIFSKFQTKIIPVIEWNFFPSIKRAKEVYNCNTWKGWDDNWIPIATDITGDPIIIKNETIYSVTHGTKEPPSPSKITNNLQEFEALLSELIKFRGFSKKSSIEKLQAKMALLKELKKLAPRPLKSDFDSVIDDIKDAIEDRKFSKTKAGRYMAECEAFANKVCKEIRKDGKFNNVMIRRHAECYALIVTGSLKEDETIEEVRSVTEKYRSPYPVEFGIFKPDNGS